ncbi:FMN-dependent NADH-azoreductase [Pseudomonas corrugata]|uniref:FMN-dependent NADH-azoreductase n=1 Tax=Pseudomonas corrugata TaxID=47879 RepID=UPI0015865984|nr:NAD(P)H-dependent oxidoreductase [Pseudomonas corrugata]MCI0997557.1 NAD(P)H-dependent oxidoreductase [Pseudomonas corrugata]NUT64725.1 FMN-dependent NADH-azoreductase [Pseudomonas corrugata]
MRVLHIDSSISADQSISRQLSSNIVARLREIHSGLEVTYRDLVAEPAPQQSPSLQFAKLKAMHDAGVLNSEMADIVTSALRSGAEVSASTLAELRISNLILDEFLASQVVIIGAPMYNFGIPSQLKSWIDILAAPGQTFRYTEAGAEGLAGGKRVIIASSRGGFYGAESPTASKDHQETFLSSFLDFIGITEPRFIRAEGVKYGPEYRQRALDSALGEIATLKLLDFADVVNPA